MKDSKLLTDLEPEFWRHYLSRWNQFNDPDDHTTVIKNVKNILSPDQGPLTIDLTKALVTDDSMTYAMDEFIALLRDDTVREAKQHIIINYEVWLEKKKQEKKTASYELDVDSLSWHKASGERVTTFDIELTAIIHRWNANELIWERSFVGKLHFLEHGRQIAKPFKFEPEDVHSFKRFSLSVWNLAMLKVSNLKEEEVLDFWIHIAKVCKPRNVREYDHFGFVYFDQKKYFLGGNVLIKLPEHEGERLDLIAPSEDKMFPVGNNYFIKPSEDIEYLPTPELGPVDPHTNRYEDALKSLFDDKLFSKRLKEVENHLRGMVGGNTEVAPWGSLILAYVFAQLFFEDIYHEFQHVVFLYLFGEGNVGKGEVCKVILSFFGQNEMSRLVTPTARYVDIGLQQHSQLPMWVDEHVPEGPGKQGKAAKIPDQNWNSWFELKPRNTSMFTGSKFKQEKKAVRSMTLFASNYKPQTDHLRSRCLMLEYSAEKRGPVQHVDWLKNEEQTLQLLIVSFLQQIAGINRKMFRHDLRRIRSLMRDEAKRRLEENNIVPQLKDRQISSYAILCTVRNWLNPEYRHEIEELFNQRKKLEENQEAYQQSNRYSQTTARLGEITFHSLYQFCVSQITRSAIESANRDPLTEWIESIGYLVQARDVTYKHYWWTEDGHLKIYAKGVWDIYDKAKRGTDDIIRRDDVESKLLDMCRLTKSGNLPVLNWSPKDMDKITQRGYYIENAYTDERFRLAFAYDHHFPAGGPKEKLEDNSNLSKGASEVATQTDMKLNKKAPF